MVRLRKCLEQFRHFFPVYTYTVIYYVNFNKLSTAERFSTDLQGNLAVTCKLGRVT